MEYNFGAIVCPQCSNTVDSSRRERKHETSVVCPNCHTYFKVRLQRGVKEYQILKTYTDEEFAVYAKRKKLSPY